MTTRKPHRLRKSRHDGDDKTFIFTELIVEAEKPVSSSAATASATKCVGIKNPFLAHMAQQTSIESSCAWFQKSRTHMASHSEEYFELSTFTDTKNRRHLPTPKTGPDRMVFSGHTFATALCGFEC